MNFLTEHFPVYDRNTYLNAEKTKKTHNSRLGTCARLLNKLIFHQIKRKKEFRLSELFSVHAYQMYSFSREYVREEAYILPTFQIYIRFLF